MWYWKYNSSGISELTDKFESRNGGGGDGKNHPEIEAPKPITSFGLGQLWYWILALSTFSWFILLFIKWYYKNTIYIYIYTYIGI